MEAKHLGCYTLVASPSVRPTLGAIAWATDGICRANASGDAAVVPGYDPSITPAITSTCVDRVTTGYVTPAMVGATSMVDSPVRPVVGSGIVAITGCSATSEGTPSMLASTYPTKGIGATMGGA